LVLQSFILSCWELGAAAGGVTAPGAAAVAAGGGAAVVAFGGVAGAVPCANVVTENAANALRSASVNIVFIGESPKAG